MGSPGAIGSRRNAGRGKLGLAMYDMPQREDQEGYSRHRQSEPYQEEAGWTLEAEEENPIPEFSYDPEAEAIIRRIRSKQPASIMIIEGVQYRWS